MDWEYHPSGAHTETSFDEQLDEVLAAAELYEYLEDVEMTNESAASPGDKILPPPEIRMNANGKQVLFYCPSPDIFPNTVKQFWDLQWPGNKSFPALIIFYKLTVSDLKVGIWNSKCPPASVLDPPGVVEEYLQASGDNRRRALSVLAGRLFLDFIKVAAFMPSHWDVKPPPIWREATESTTQPAMQNPIVDVQMTLDGPVGVTDKRLGKRRERTPTAAPGRLPRVQKIRAKPTIPGQIRGVMQYDYDLVFSAAESSSKARSGGNAQEARVVNHITSEEPTVAPRRSLDILKISSILS